MRRGSKYEQQKKNKKKRCSVQITGGKRWEAIFGMKCLSNISGGRVRSAREAPTGANHSISTASPGDAHALLLRPCTYVYAEERTGRFCSHVFILFYFFFFYFLRFSLGFVRAARVNRSMPKNPLCGEEPQAAFSRATSNGCDSSSLQTTLFSPGSLSG